MSYQHEQDVLKVLDSLIAVVRDVKSKETRQYMLSMKEDGDRIVSKTDAMLAQQFAEEKIDRELRIVDQELHNGECVVWRAEATDKHPSGKQPCYDKIKARLMHMAERRVINGEPGRVLGTTAEEIDKLSDQELEEFRKAVCSQRTGGVQIENKVFYYLGSANTNFVHRALGKRFQDVGSMYKDPAMRRTYWIMFEKDKSAAGTLREAQKELKTHAELAHKRAEEKKAEREKLRKAAAAKKAGEAEKKDDKQKAPEKEDSTVVAERG